MENNIIPTEHNLAVSQESPSLLDMRADPSRFPRLKSVTREEAVYEMSKIVSQAFLYRGQAADQTNIQFISSALVNELLEDRQYGASNISFAEIKVVVKRAVLGGSEMYGISVASLYKVIMDFVKGEGCRNQHQIQDMKRKSEEESLKNSIIAPMLQAYQTELVNHTKSK